VVIPVLARQARTQQGALMRAAAGARIWYQSLTDPDADRPYFTRLSGYLRSVTSPGCEVEAFGIQPGARHPHPITEFRRAAQVIANALTAQEQGYNAFVLGHFQEPGLAEARSAVRIPVIGLGEATMLHACTLGRKIGLVATSPVFVPWHEDQIARHGLQQRVIAVRALHAQTGQFNRAFDDEGEYRRVRISPLHLCTGWGKTHLYRRRQPDVSETAGQRRSARASSQPGPDTLDPGGDHAPDSLRSCPPRCGGRDAPRRPG
jgi:Asp/Glu/Hydantoin racemase